MQWYFDRTVLFITNSGDAGPSNSYRDWGGQAQAYVEGFRHIHERAQRRMDDQAGSGGQGGGTSQALQEFQQTPQYMMSFGGDMDRMNYGSQQFHFPASDYYPQQPDNQFETYQPGPQFETYQPGPQFERYQPENQFETYQPGPLVMIMIFLLVSNYHIRMLEATTTRVLMSTKRTPGQVLPTKFSGPQ